MEDLRYRRFLINPMIMINGKFFFKAGDQLLKVDGQSLVGITQERAAEIMMQTGQVVELEVAKQVSYFYKGVI